MNEERLDEIKLRHYLATDGTWEWSESTDYYVKTWIVESEDHLVMYLRTSSDGDRVEAPCGNDGEFMAHAHQDIPDLLEHIEKLQKELDAAIHAVTVCGQAKDKLEQQLANKDMECKERLDEAYASWEYMSFGTGPNS